MTTTRLRSSCRSCHKSHKKCDGTNELACTRCQKRNETCVWDVQRKRGPKRKRKDSLVSDDSDSFVIASKPQQSDEPYNLSPKHKRQKTTIAPDSQSQYPQPVAEANPSLFPTSLYESHCNIIPVRLLLGASGSVASIKMPQLVNKLARLRVPFPDQAGNRWELRFLVNVILTDAASRFVTKDQIIDYVKSQKQESEGGVSSAVLEHIKVFQDEDEWRQWQKKGDPVTHIDLRQESDLFLIAPLSANSLAKIANGLCDNLLTCVIRAWNFNEKPVSVCPAMNTVMWNSPFTSKHLGVLSKELGVHIIDPVSKQLACGETGVGAMAHVDDIVKETVHRAFRDIIQHRVSARGGGCIIIPIEYGPSILSNGVPVVPQGNHPGSTSGANQGHGQCRGGGHGHSGHHTHAHSHNPSHNPNPNHSHNPNHHHNPGHTSHNHNGVSSTQPPGQATPHGSHSTTHSTGHNVQPGGHVHDQHTQHNQHSNPHGPLPPIQYTNPKHHPSKRHSGHMPMASHVSPSYGSTMQGTSAPPSGAPHHSHSNPSGHPHHHGVHHGPNYPHA